MENTENVRDASIEQDAPTCSRREMLQQTMGMTLSPIAEINLCQNKIESISKHMHLVLNARCRRSLEFFVTYKEHPDLSFEEIDRKIPLCAAKAARELLAECDEPMRYHFICTEMEYRLCKRRPDHIIHQLMEYAFSRSGDADIRRCLTVEVWNTWRRTGDYYQSIIKGKTMDIIKKIPSMQIDEELMEKIIDRMCHPGTDISLAIIDDGKFGIDAHLYSIEWIMRDLKKYGSIQLVSDMQRTFFYSLMNRHVSSKAIAIPYHTLPADHGYRQSLQLQPSHLQSHIYR